MQTVLILVLGIIILVISNLYLLRKYENCEQERKRAQQRLDAVLQENKNLFFDQLKKYGIELDELNKH